MKKSFSLLPVIFAFLLLISFESTQAQLLKRIRNEVKSRVENKIVNRAGDTVDKTIDKATGAVQKDNNTNSQTESNSTSSNPSVPDKFKGYKNYDFVPGDKIIFQPDMSHEADAELPARFIIEHGVAEIQSDNGEKVVHLDKGSKAVIAPDMNSDTYLPEQFTVEFDMNMDEYYHHPEAIGVQFRTANDRNFGASPLCEFSILWNTSCIFGNYAKAGEIAFSKELTTSMQQPGTWHHVAVYVHKNIGKAYIDGNRVYASNTLPSGIAKLDIKGNANFGYKIKNFRIAEGGDDKYKKIVTDGKFITHGILFDVNKSSIKPESTGALNEVVKLMQEHEDLNFEIDGHTDSDGNDDANMKLSQARAESVKAKLIDMGIEASRLTAKGFGETIPMDKNDTAEGKANNRRVEFVKI